MAFLSVESTTYVLYVNIHFTGNLFFGFGRYCGKSFSEPASFHLSWESALAKNAFSIFFHGDS